MSAAPTDVRHRLANAREKIDEVFGDGFAVAHAELVGYVVLADALLACAASDDGSQLDWVAEALAEFVNPPHKSGQH